MTTEATFCPTKAGNGFKIIVDNEWFYTSKYELFRVLNRKAAACKFRKIEKEND